MGRGDRLWHVRLLGSAVAEGRPFGVLSGALALSWRQCGAHGGLEAGSSCQN